MHGDAQIAKPKAGAKKDCPTLFNIFDKYYFCSTIFYGVNNFSPHFLMGYNIGLELEPDPAPK